MRYAESIGVVILSTDQQDFSEMVANVPILVAPQDMSGGEVRQAVGILDSLPADPAQMKPIWLSGLV